MLLLEYPKIIENCDLRSDKRIDCLLPAKIKVKDKEKHGAVLDISERGCRYSTRASKGGKLPSVQVDEQITLMCQFPGIEAEQVVTGVVKNVRTDKQEMSLEIEFHDIAPEVQNIIDRYISIVKEFY